MSSSSNTKLRYVYHLFNSSKELPVYTVCCVTSELSVITASALVTPLRRAVYMFLVGLEELPCIGFMTTEITGVQEELWSDAVPDTIVTGDRTRHTLHLSNLLLRP